VQYYYLKNKNREEGRAPTRAMIVLAGL